MKRAIRLLSLWFVTLALADSAQGTVTIEHRLSLPYDCFTASPTPGCPGLGGAFTVDVRLNWDGSGSLRGVFTSTIFNSGVVEFVGNTTAPPSVLFVVDPTNPDDPIVNPGLTRLLSSIRIPSDPSGVLRTVQYGAFSPADPRGATTGDGILITRLTFRMIRGGPPADIRGGIAQGDVGAWGDEIVFVTTPEPGTSVLVGVGLAVLSYARRRR